MLLKRGLGYRPGKPDSRDRPLHQLLGLAQPYDPPARSDGLRGYLGRLLDQQDSEGCVGWSFVNGVWARWNYLAATSGRPGPVAQPSPLWPWWLARQSEQQTALNVGCYVSDALNQVRQVGIASESQWPSDQPTSIQAGVPRWAAQPSVATFRQAVDQRFPLEYYRCDLDGSGPKKPQFQRAIAAGYPVQFGTLVTNDFIGIGTHGPQPVPNSSQTIAGGHSLTALYYDEQGVYGPNNWTAAWGNAGWFALSWDYIEWEKTYDCWALACELPIAGWA